jgi:hypothetical protein
VKLHIARGRSDVISNLIDALKYPLPRREGVQLTDEQEEGARIREDTEQQLEAILSDTEAVGLDVRRNAKGQFLSVEEVTPSFTDTIAAEYGEMGTIAYRDLSGVVHGGLSSLLSRMVPVHSAGGKTLMEPDDASNHLPSLGAAFVAYKKANEKRIHLYRWQAAQWIQWQESIRGTMRALFPPIR